MLNSIKTYLKAIEQTLLLMTETRLVYSQKVNYLRALDPLINAQSDVEIVKDALNTALLVKKYGVLNDDILREIIEESLKKGKKS